MKLSIAATPSTYRSHRTMLLEQHSRIQLSGDSHHTRMQNLRAIVSSMRSSARHTIESTWSTTVQAPCEAKHILRIPQDLVLFKPSNWAIVGQFLLGAFIPDKWLYAHAKKLLSGVRTFEGRAFIYAHFLCGMFGSRHYSESLDLILRKFQVQSCDDITYLERLDFDALRAFAKLGLLNAKDISQVWTSSTVSRSSSLLWLLVSTGVIQTSADLGWMRINKRNSIGEGALDHEARQAVFAVIKHLTTACIPASTIAHVVSASNAHFRDVSHLPKAISELQNVGLSVNEMLLAVEDRVWRTAPSRWRFMVNVMGLRNPVEIALFVGVLDHHAEPAPCFVRALLSAGATPNDLLICERLLRANAVPSKASHAATAVQLLTSTPFNIAVGELTDFSSYICNDRDLTTFLQALINTGFQTKEAVLALQTCYMSAANQNVKALLSLASSHCGSASLEEVAGWVSIAGRDGYVLISTQK